MYYFLNLGVMTDVSIMYSQRTPGFEQRFVNQVNKNAFVGCWGLDVITAQRTFKAKAYLPSININITYSCTLDYDMRMSASCFDVESVKNAALSLKIEFQRKICSGGVIHLQSSMTSKATKGQDTRFDASPFPYTVSCDTLVTSTDFPPCNSANYQSAAESAQVGNDIVFMDDKMYTPFNTQTIFVCGASPTSPSSCNGNNISCLGTGAEFYGKCSNITSYTAATIFVPGSFVQCAKDIASQTYTYICTERQNVGSVSFFSAVSQSFSIAAGFYGGAMILFSFLYGRCCREDDIMAAQVEGKKGAGYLCAPSIPQGYAFRPSSSDEMREGRGESVQLSTVE